MTETVQCEAAKPAAVDEYERERVPESATKGLKSFVGLFASEHVAGTELVIGPLFVAAGVSAFDLMVGLLVGNLLAVLSWTLLTAPIAVRNRLTLYFQLEKIGGAGVIRYYNFANGVLWCCVGSAMIYVSATALFVPFKIPDPTAWYPNGPGMIACVVGLGLVITIVAAKGYDAIARFANVAAPWMIVMFLIFGILALPQLGVNSPGKFWEVANTTIWPGKAKPGHVQFTFWHVVCFAWFGNMAWHIGMGDLSLFRYAKKARYGLASSAGMIIGHYMAWITAGLLYAVYLQANPNARDPVPGPMAWNVLGPEAGTPFSISQLSAYAAGICGVLLVVVAGWTTANPILYRAGLAFQSLRPKWSRVRVTLVSGAIASVIGIFPGLCGKFLSIAMLYGLVLMPMGAVLFADEYFLKPLGLLPRYAERRGLNLWWPPMVAWIASLLICLGLKFFVGMSEFFLCLPVWFISVFIYLVVSRIMQKQGCPKCGAGHRRSANFCPECGTPVKPTSDCSTAGGVA